MPKSIEALIECPFYIKEGESFITCEGVFNGTKCTHRFANDKDKQGYEKNVCSVNCGKSCVHHKNISSLYERGLRV